MLDKLESTLRDTCKLDKVRPILAGVSGGPDSLCLLSLLHEAGWSVIAAHFNHLLRPEAEEEAAAVEALAARMDVPFVGGRGDVRALATREKISIETAARQLRYRFLFEQARLFHAQAVAVGHTADDQVETMLMHLIRGAGLNGLKGMSYRSCLREHDPEIPLVRPLLDMWRLDTVAYCESRGLEPHYDASNASVEFLRNRLRHELIPALEAYNPRFREAAYRTIKTLSADHELLTTLLQPVWEQVLVRLTPAYAELDLVRLSAHTPAVQVHIIQLAAADLAPKCEIGFDALQRAAAFIADGAEERTDLTGGLFLLREGSRLYLAAAESDLPRDQWPQMPADIDSIRFTLPFDVDLASAWRFSASESGVAGVGVAETWKESNPYQAWIDLSGLPAELELRIRRDGDRFEPLGMDGHSQKLSDFFVNVKLPARARERWPLLCAGDEIIWIPGYRPAHRCRLQPGSKNLLYLAVQPPSPVH